MCLEDYSSDKIKQASELELQQMLNKFRYQQISIAKFGYFVAYNFIALSSLIGISSWYVKSNWIKKGQPKKYKPEQLTLRNIALKGTKIGVIIGGIYLAGFAAIGYYALPFPALKKYCQIKQALHSYEVKFDPYFQQMLLYRKMVKFGLSDRFIEQVKQDLNKQKQELILNKKLKQQTITAIRKSQQVFQSIRLPRE